MRTFVFSVLASLTMFAHPAFTQDFIPSASASSVGTVTATPTDPQYDSNSDNQTRVEVGIARMDGQPIDQNKSDKIQAYLDGLRSACVNMDPTDWAACYSQQVYFAGQQHQFGDGMYVTTVVRTDTSSQTQQ